MAPATATKKRADKSSGNTLARAAYGEQAQSRRQLYDMVVKLDGTQPSAADAKQLRGLLTETSSTSEDIERWTQALARRAELQTLAGAVGDAVERRRSGRAELKAARKKLADLRETIEQLERGLGRLGAGVRDSLRAEEQLAELEYEHAELFNIDRPQDLDAVTLLSGGEVIGVADDSAPEQHVPAEVLREQGQRRSAIFQAARAEAQAQTSALFDRWHESDYAGVDGRTHNRTPPPQKVEVTWASIAQLTRVERDRLARIGARA